MTNDLVGFAKYARDLRALGPWAPLFVVAILFLDIGVDITSGHAADPAIMGHGYLALFSLGLVATLVVRGRRRAMGHVCFGLAVLDGAFLGVCYFRGYIAITVPMVLIAGLTIGGLCAAALLFRRVPPPTPLPANRRTA